MNAKRVYFPYDFNFNSIYIFRTFKLHVYIKYTLKIKQLIQKANKSMNRQNEYGDQIIFLKTGLPHLNYKFQI